ncbi:Holliday junction resolvase RuvX [Streptobacillus moniliformis]|uniref:Putative pre-16S rRNA nuclease n=1 Tax=Streptobacillus moniliformis (strain ATCC 14647 / DSM 12112 / NCTC 10651 / 9901) TaxID=519441 RepID=D1AX73_STRM9|nr:Holliday junction resolvase RuvX [Streptobacillus moniliformis]ACZ00899.1 Holliday junction resolvase YqgF [Streptobacillus moniliformis DSM 12112]AVL42715.1 Holliday junction resolvase RuvX [Streptobacillus moniliformis]SQA13963.1 Putative Holliday junction resolvase [Streptobacillus moniliformis]
MKIYLGLDIGDVRIGVAKSDGLAMFASSYEVIDRNITDPFERIKEIINSEKVIALVLGLPKTKDGQNSIQVEKIERFVSELKLFIPENLPIHYIDERYTTKEAEYYLKNFSKKNGKERRKVVDMVAAQIILQNFLDKYRGKI